MTAILTPLVDEERCDECTGWGAYDWSKPSLAVVVSNGTKISVPWTVGVHVQFDLVEHGLYFEDLGLDPPDAGIWIWEGKTVAEQSYEGEHDAYLDGTFRAPTDEEWAAIKRGVCPWDDSLWLKPLTCGHVAEEGAR